MLLLLHPTHTRTPYHAITIWAHFNTHFYTCKKEIQYSHEQQLGGPGQGELTHVQYVPLCFFQQSENKYNYVKSNSLALRLMLPFYLLNLLLVVREHGLYFMRIEKEPQSKNNLTLIS